MSTFKARYGGRCAASCGEQIRPGDEVVYVDDELMHADCEEAALAVGRRRAETCTVCWLAKPCPCEDEQ